MRLTKPMVFAVALAAAASVGAESRGRSASSSPFDLAPRPVAKTTEARPATPSPEMLMQKELGGGAVAILELDSPPSTASRGPAGLMALFEFDEGTPRAAAQGPQIMRLLDTQEGDAPVAAAPTSVGNGIGSQSSEPARTGSGN